MVDEEKICGILVEVAGGLAISGIGVNVGQSAATIGVPEATSLKMLGVEVPRDHVAAAVLGQLGRILPLVETVGGRGQLLDAYRAVSATLDRDVRVWLGDDTWVEGKAIDIAEDGQLLVQVGEELRSFASGDVRHLRSAIDTDG
jgi:BirA family biotin operon repressor/biotin-[acetyl-CoA-carboxylase] ligase